MKWIVVIFRFFFLQVRYTSYRDRPHEERQNRFQMGCREGHVDIVSIKSIITIRNAAEYLPIFFRLLFIHFSFSFCYHNIGFRHNGYKSATHVYTEYAVDDILPPTHYWLLRFWKRTRNGKEIHLIYWRNLFFQNQS